MSVAGKLVLDNVTISNNTFNVLNDDVHGGVLVESSSSKLILKNCVITDIIGSTNGALNISHSDINTAIKGPIAVTWGAGNINSNPKFDYNFGLLAGSPCINTGEPTKLDKDGSRCDMGYTGGKGIFSSTVKVCTKGNIFAIAPRFLEIGANCSPLLTYASGESENFVATEQITLKNGFTCKTGSLLSFKIKPYYNEPFLYDDKCTALKGPDNSSDPSIISNKDTESIDKDFNFNAFPNPTEGSITILLINSEEVCIVELLNILGVVLKESIITDSIIDLSISEFKPGPYFVKVTSGNSIKTKIIIKQ